MDSGGAINDSTGEELLEQATQEAQQWTDEFIAGGVKEKAWQQHLDEGHTTPLDPHICDEKCDGCVKAFTQDKPQYQLSKSGHEEKLETLNGDLLDMKFKDCGGNRYNFNAVVLRTGLGMSKGLPNKSSGGVAKAFQRFKHRVESNTDPGGKLNYKIERFAHDPGSEFAGAMRDILARDNIVDRPGETDRHGDNAVVEARNKRLQTVACAMAATAMAENQEL